MLPQGVAGSFIIFEYRKAKSVALEKCLYLVHQHKAFLISRLRKRVSLQSRKLISALRLGGHRDGCCGFTAFLFCQEGTDRDRNRECQKRTIA